MAERVRVGIAGMDHWYAARAAGEEVRRDPRMALTVLAHRERALAEEAGKEFGAGEVTTDYAAVVRHPEVDLVVTACTTAENAALVQEALAHGKAVVSVKPIGMTVAEADAVVEASRRTGRPVFPLESQMRLYAAHRQIRAWLTQGKLGRPLSALVVLRGQVPTQDWPGRQVGKTWWQDPARVPGGGWIDHAIYHVDAFRWLLGSEVVRVYAETSRLKHPELEVEDFGTATLTFANGVVATLEVTWAGTPGAWVHTWHLVGTDGQVVVDDPFGPGLRVAGGGGAPGWRVETLTEQAVPILGHVVDALTRGTPLVATAEDARTNLAVCLAAYESARTHQAVHLV